MSQTPCPAWVLPLLSGDLINNNKENTDEDLPQPYVVGHRNDMVKWAGKWNAAAKDIFSAPYMAMLLDPFLMNPADQQHDIYWVGYSPNCAAQGAVLDDWNAKAGKLADELLKIADCDTHAIWAMTTTRGSGNTTPPATGVLTFQACSMVGDTTMMDLAAAEAQMNAFMDNI